MSRSQHTAEFPPLIPRKVLFGNPDKFSPRISPDGSLLAYCAPYKGVLNVWVRTLCGDDDRVITEEGRGVRFLLWQADSKHILYIQDYDGDENWHLYQTCLETGNTRDLTPFKGVQAEMVALDPNFPSEILVAINLRDRRYPDVYRINLRNGALELDTENPGRVSAWGVDNALRVRIRNVRLPDGGTEIQIRDDNLAPWHIFQRWGPDEAFGGVVAFTPDNKDVFLISSVNANAARLLRVELATGNISTVAEDDCYDIERVLIHPRERTLEAARFVRARGEWMLLDHSLHADFEALRAVRDGDFDIESRDFNNSTWIISYLVDDGPVYYYLYRRGDREANFLFSNRSELEKYKLSKMQPITFLARDRMVIHGYLTLPLGKGPPNVPLVLLVHGGPWTRDTWGLNTFVQWLANRGYAVLQINFRGSTGYGKAHLNAGNREWGGKMHTDLLDAKEWAIQQGFNDRICIMGGSYGGYATLVALAFTPDEFACGVDMIGPSNLVTFLKNIPPYWAPEKSLLSTRVGDVETEEDFLISRSPLFRANQIKVPLLIVHGANDVRVKQAESDQIVSAMRQNNLPVEYLLFPDEGHGFVRPDSVLKFIALAEHFLAQHLGGRTEEING